MNKREQELVVAMIDHVEAILESVPNPKGQVKRIRLKKVREGGSELHRLAGEAIFGYDLIKLVQPDKRLPAHRILEHRQDAFKQWSKMTAKQKSMLPNVVNDECRAMARSAIQKIKMDERLRDRELKNKAAELAASEVKISDDRHSWEDKQVEAAVAKAAQAERIVELEEMSADGT